MEKLKKMIKPVLWGLLAMAILGMVIGFATDHFMFAYRIMLVLALVLIGGGSVYHVKNQERQYLDDFRRYNRSYENRTRDDDFLRYGFTSGSPPGVSSRIEAG